MNTWLLVLSLAGVTVAFAGSLTEKVRSKQSLRVAVAVITVGFVITIAHLLLSNLSDRAEAALKKNLEGQRDQLLERIRSTASENLRLTEQIAGRLENASLESVGDLLPSFQAATEEQAVAQFAKGDAQAWQRFAAWLGQDRPRNAALTLTVGRGQHYSAGLVAAYALTGTNTRSRMAEIVGQYVFSRPEAFARLPVRVDGGVKYVVLRDHDSQVIGFAPAALFAREILAYMSAGDAERVENALTAVDPRRELAPLFTSLKLETIEASEPATVARDMLAKNMTDAVIARGRDLFYVRVSTLVRKADAR